MSAVGPNAGVDVFRQESVGRKELIRVITVLVGLGASFALTAAAHSNLGIAASLVTMSFVTAAAAILFRSLNRLSRPGAPTDRVADEAVRRVQCTCQSLLDLRYATRWEIDTSVSLGRVPTDSKKSVDLDAVHANSETVSDSLFIAQFFESDRRLTFLLGDKGSGKTTLLLRLATHIADDHLAGRTNDVPMVFTLRGWHPRVPVRRWVRKQASDTYAVPTHVTDRWLEAGRLVLLLDGLDEVATEHLPRLCTELRLWSLALDANRIIVSARASIANLSQVIPMLGADQLARLHPVPTEKAAVYVVEALHRLSDRTDGVLEHGQQFDRLDRLFRTLIADDEMMWAPALFGLMAASGVAAAGNDEHHLLPEGPAGSRDPGEPDFLAGNARFAERDFAAAKDAYQKVSMIAGSQRRALATALYGVCEALLGNEPEARRALHDSVAVHLAESITPGATYRLTTCTNDDERQVVRSMTAGITYDLAQLSSRSGLPPSRTRAALRMLRELGAVQTSRDTSDRIRYQRSETFATEGC